MKSILKRLHILLLLTLPINLLGQFINPGLVLTFDDNSIENWHKLIPIFQKYNAKATFFICRPYKFDSIQNQLILDLHASGNEIGSHGYFHYNSVNYCDTSTIDAYIAAEIIPSMHWFESVLNIKLTSFAYPFGARNERIDSELIKYFKMIRGTNYSILGSGNKIEKLSHSGLVYGVGIDNGYGNSLSDIKKSLDQCINDSLIQIFYSHTPKDSVTDDYQISYSTLDSVLRYATEIGLSFYSFSDAWLPIPPTPIGDTLIDETQILSSYFTEKDNLDIKWTMSPVESGTLNYLDSVATINWNLDFEGTVMLQAAYLNKCGQGDFSSQLIINRKINLDINDVSTSNINIYPNPSKGKITIFIVGNSKKSIDIINASGQVIYSAINKTESFTLNIRNKGIYIVRVISDNVLVTKPFVIE